MVFLKRNCARKIYKTQGRLYTGIGGTRSIYISNEQDTARLKLISSIKEGEYAVICRNLQNLKSIRNI